MKSLLEANEWRPGTFVFMVTMIHTDKSTTERLENRILRQLSVRLLFNLDIWLERNAPK